MSAIHQAVSRYLALRRALGFKLQMEGAWLKQFASFLEQRGSCRITTALALEWATLTTGQPQHSAHRLSVVRNFAAFHAATDLRTEVPPHGLLPHRYRRKPPYIYSDEEIDRLLGAAAKLRSSTGLRPRTYTTVLGLLAVTGMRSGEVVALNRDDVDLFEGVLTIRRTKFGKSRIVPMHASTCAALQCYADWRDQVLPKPRTASFFVGDNGSRLVLNTVEQTFVKLTRQVGLRGPSDRRGPRLHDIRHRFAVNTILRWYRTGVDVECQLPKLATYLGHGHVTDTYWYLSATPELMGQVLARLERSAGSQS